MLNWIKLHELIDMNNNGEPITKEIFVKVSSINTFRTSNFMGISEATQVNLQNDCIWVTETPSLIMDSCSGYGFIRHNDLYNEKEGMDTIETVPD